MLRSYSGLMSIEDLQERQASQGVDVDMESRPGESSGSYSLQTDPVRKLVRVIIVRALRDLGTGERGEREEVWEWVNSEAFETMIMWANWDGGWILDVFESVNSLGESVRVPITRDCVRMLKDIGNIT